MEHSETNKPTWRLTNPHDRFCRRTAFHPVYAPDFLKSYGDSVLAKFVDLDHLEEAPTTHLSDELKEVIMDASLLTRLVNTPSAAEVLFHLEHKSKPSRSVVVQLLMEVALALHFRWFMSKRPESGTFTPPIPLMVVVYNGKADWDGEIQFQDLFPDLPEELRPFVPQFRVFFINLRRFQYGNLPGRPETQAIAESLMRATDGTFIAHLSGVLKHVADGGLDEPLRLDLVRTISSYCTWVAQASSEQITNAITTVFKGQEAINMIEAIKNSFVLEGIEIGEARGKVASKIETLLAVLNGKFKSVPKHVTDDIGRMTDPIALDSLTVLASTSTSIDEIVEALR